MTSTKIILWTGMLFATAFATATIYSFLSNSHYKILRYLRFPTTFLFPAILYFNMDFNNQALMEFMKNIWTFYQNNSQYFDIKRVVEFLKELPLSFWIIATFMTWGWMFSSMLTTLSNVYFQQNDCAVQSTSAILHTVNQIVTSFQAAFQIVFTSLQAAFQIFFAGVTVTVSSHFPIICLCILFSMGIALLIASLLFSKGKQQWAFALIAVILAAPGYIYLVYWIIKSPKV